MRSIGDFGVTFGIDYANRFHPGLDDGVRAKPEGLPACRNGAEAARGGPLAAFKRQQQKLEVVFTAAAGEAGDGQDGAGSQGERSPLSPAIMFWSSFSRASGMKNP